MALMQHNATNKRRLMATDVRNDALGRMGTIRTLIELLFGRRAGALVCRNWRDASRGLALTKGEEDSLVRAVAADHTNSHLLCLYASGAYPGGYVFGQLRELGRSHTRCLWWCTTIKPCDS